MNKKPIHTKASQTGNLAVTHCQKLFEEKKWVFRRGDANTDFGIDAEVEIVDSNEVTGKMFKCQIKGTESIEWLGGYYSIAVKTSTWNYWKSLSLPTIALLVDIPTQNIYWTLPLSNTPEDNAETVSLRFASENNIKISFDVLRSIIETWLENFPDKNILRNVPCFNKQYMNELKEAIDWGDPWVEIDEELDYKTRLFYGHVLELRLSTGLTNEKIIPLEYWYVRNCGLWDGESILYHSVYSELMKYISPYYEEALSSLLERTKKVEETFENSELINYFKLHPLLKGTKTNNIIVSFAHPLQNDDKFHAHIENELKKINALKISWFSKKSR